MAGCGSASSRRPRIAGLLATAVASGCAPRVFGDDSGIAILGTAPPPVEAPAPPPEPQKRVEVREDRIVINEKIQFAVDSAKILEASHDLLNEVAKVIKEHPRIKKIHIEGHASAEGSDAHNLKLSKNRANAVMKYLTKTGGIAKDMLSAEGYDVATASDGLAGLVKATASKPALMNSISGLNSSSAGSQCFSISWRIAGPLVYAGTGRFTMLSPSGSWPLYG